MEKNLRRIIFGIFVFSFSAPHLAGAAGVLAAVNSSLGCTNIGDSLQYTGITVTCQPRATFTSIPTAQYWIAPSGSGGSDSNAGTIASPFLTVAHALGVATSPGTYVYMRAGTYSIGSSTTWSAANAGITLEAFPGETVIIDGASTADPIFSINNAPNLTIQGIQFQNTKGSGSTYGAIQLYESQNANIVANNFVNIWNGLYIQSSSWDTIQGNKFTNIGGVGGVVIGGGSNNNTVTNNILDTNTNLVGGTGTSSAGIFVANAPGTTITHNIIRNMIGSGIVVATQTPGTAFNSIYGTIIQYNYMTNNITSSSASDCGNIYTDNQGLQLNNNILIDHNYVANAVQASPSLDVAIYLDDWTSGAVVTNNLASGFNFGFLLHAGQNNNISNNVFNMGTLVTSTFGAGLIQGEAGFTGGSMNGNQITKNIIYSTATTAPTIWTDYTSGISNIAKNYYYNTNSQSMTTNNGISDSAPVTGANPQFLSPSTGNYDMISPNQPGFLGFKPVNQGLIGLQTGIVHWPVGWS